MWYVIQTVNGEEQQVCTWINQRMDRALFRRCFVPLYEDVWRKEGIGNISIRKMFDGCLFLEADRREAVWEALQKIPDVGILFEGKENPDSLLIPVHKEEEEFFKNVLTDGLMRVSYLERDENGKIISVIGPLEVYQEYIVKIDLPHRRAIVELPLFGEKRRLKFGLWSTKDPAIPWLEEKKGISVERCLKKEMPAVLQKGDYVVNTTGIYGDTILKVTKMDEKSRTITAKTFLFEKEISVQMCMDEVRKEERRKAENEGIRA